MAQAAAGEAGKVGLSAAVLLLPPAVTFALGTWQLQRRQWKIQLLELRQQRLEQEAVPIATALAEASEPPSEREEVAAMGTPEGVCSTLEYRRVVCCGHMAEEQSMFVGPRGRSVHGVTEKGFYVITPLVPTEATKDQPAVLLNRGWVPGSWRDAHDVASSGPSIGPSGGADATLTSASLGQRGEAEAAPPSKIETKSRWWMWGQSAADSSRDSKAASPSPSPSLPPSVCVSGVVRCSEVPSSFVPPNGPERGEWFYIDGPAMARARGLPESTPLVDLVGEGERGGRREGERERERGGGAKQFPAPKDVADLLQQKVMPHDHLLYSATWYTLSAATSFLAFKALRRPPVRRGRRQSS